MTSNKVVVTGFGPFGPHESNPSSHVAKALSKYPINDCTVISHEMKVVYSEVSDTVPKLWMEHNPDLVIHIGVHSVPRCVKIESKAFADGYCRYDVDGHVPPNNKCVVNMDQTLKCAIDVEDLVKMTKEEVGELPKDFNIESSDDPGRYLCGFSYYLSLSNDNTKTLFIHIPPLSNDVTIELLTRIIATIILNVFKHF